jgi:hypothetical protein
MYDSGVESVYPKLMPLIVTVISASCLVVVGRFAGVDHVMMGASNVTAKFCAPAPPAEFVPWTRAPPLGLRPPFAYATTYRCAMTPKSAGWHRTAVFVVQPVVWHISGLPVVASDGVMSSTPKFKPKTVMEAMPTEAAIAGKLAGLANVTTGALYVNVNCLEPPAAPRATEIVRNALNPDGARHMTYEFVDHAVVSQRLLGSGCNPAISEVAV